MGQLDKSPGTHQHMKTEISLIKIIFIFNYPRHRKKWQNLNHSENLKNHFSN